MSIKIRDYTNVTTGFLDGAWSTIEANKNEMPGGMYYAFTQLFQALDSIEQRITKLEQTTRKKILP